MSITPSKGWGLQYSYRNARGGFLLGQFHPTRSAAIAEYDSWWTEPGAYARERRKGNLLAVRVQITVAT